MDRNEAALGEPSSRGMVWTGRLLSGLFILFMIFDIAIKLIGVPQVAQTLQGLGWPGSSGGWIGVMELVILLLYLYPRTSVLGAILLTGLLGGAIATNVRIEKPLFSHELFGLYLGLFAWGGLWLRDARLRAVFPWSR